MIAGFFDPATPGPVPRVRVLVLSPQITQGWVPVDFLLDTGAASTCLHPIDAIFTVGIDPRALADPQCWSQPRTYGGVGGRGVYYIVPITYGFEHLGGHLQTISGELAIAQPQLHNAGLASLLGRDLLQYFHVSIDWPRQHLTLA